jgi:hypothetical protein
MAAAILGQGNARSATTPRAPRPTPATAQDATRQDEARKAERSLQTLLKLAEGRGEKAAYLLALDFLTEVNRCAANQSLTGEKGAALVQRSLHDGVHEGHLRNIILVAGAHIPPGSSLTLRESHALLSQRLGGPA